MAYTPQLKDRLSEWTQNQDKKQRKKIPTICCLWETHFKYIDTNRHRNKNKRMEKMYCANTKKAEDS